MKRIIAAAMGLALATGGVALAQSGVPNASVAIASYTFAPPTLTVPAGTTVRFRNDDPDPHTVTADDGSWDSGGLEAGNTFQHTFAKPGTYTYACALHPWMRGTVVVTGRRS
ncbi:MAG: cupredoxin family copper-binding protein [bacterium]|nr:cupredoxin family copper-binding protein [bacterium]